MSFSALVSWCPRWAALKPPLLQGTRGLIRTVLWGLQTMRFPDAGVRFWLNVLWTSSALLLVARCSPSGAWVLSPEE